jgi:uncharacterized protein with GYD domain
MPKYLMRATYNVDGLKGLIKDGGIGRREATEQALQAVNGTLEAYYFAFGESDVYLIVDLPDNVIALAGSLVSNAVGTDRLTTTVLITPEEVDQATNMVKELGAAYRPPGE